MGAITPFLAVVLVFLRASTLLASGPSHTELTDAIKTQLDSMQSEIQLTELTAAIKTQLDSMQSEIQLIRRMVGVVASDCPPGFVFLPESESCYKVVTDARRNWTASSQKCQDLYSGAHLAAITTECESNAITGLLISGNSTLGGNFFWIGGQRIIINNCTSKFVWKLPGNIQTSMSFINWDSGEPNCCVYTQGIESCTMIRPDHEFRWNDVLCSSEAYAVCEYNPPAQRSCL